MDQVAVTPRTMQEPYRSQFAQMIRSGAASRDIHDSDGAGEYDSDSDTAVSEQFLQREMERVDVHARSLCAPTLARIGVASRVLDMGCGTGGTTVALALPEFGAHRVIGVDASLSAVEAARVRAQAYGLSDEQIGFLHLPAGSPLPFDDGEFDLVTCISVLEFLATEASRRDFVRELMRVLRPRGHLLLATPSPFHLREYHSGRWLGDWRRQVGFPWSSTPAALRAMFAPHAAWSLASDRMKRHPLLRSIAWAAPAVSWMFPWQQWLVRKVDDDPPGF